MQLDAFSEIFSDLHDPHQSVKIVYPLFDIVFLMVCSVICGCEDFGQAHYHWFQDKGLFPYELPVHAIVVRAISRQAPDEFQTSFLAVHLRASGELIVIDGKVLRSPDRQSNIHMVSAFACVNGIVLG